jgi:hypothetical protein
MLVLYHFIIAVFSVIGSVDRAYGGRRHFGQMWRFLTLKYVTKPESGPMLYVLLEVRRRNRSITYVKNAKKLVVRAPDKDILVRTLPKKCSVKDRF